MNPSDHDHEVTQWLVYIVITVTTALISLWNRHIMGRVERLEESNNYTDTMVQELERRLEERFQLHEKYEREIDERHLLMMHAEISGLRKELNDGHKEILDRVHALSREMRSGNNR